MLEFAICSRCGYRTTLDDIMKIYDSGDNSELIYTGKCKICKNTVEKHYPLTKGDPT
ncbi:hypothetical protein [Methanobacterium sp. SMA-27]|uniref:hypothetical protein n=1 Tax=Methanobacterium sp. SMA-27 TaxID=1495336 RepID=UPI000A88C5A4|nr:hypothetical protein [Methanobacterium sp. SMA-27]